MNCRKTVSILLCSLMVFLLCTGCSPRRSGVIDRSCSTCHDASVVYEKKRTQGEWERIMFAMKARGLKIAPEQERQVMEFLSRSYTRERS